MLIPTEATDVETVIMVDDQASSIKQPILAIEDEKIVDGYIEHRLQTLQFEYAQKTSQLTRNSTSYAGGGRSRFQEDTKQINLTPEKIEKFQKLKNATLKELDELCLKAKNRTLRSQIIKFSTLIKKHVSLTSDLSESALSREDRSKIIQQRHITTAVKTIQKPSQSFKKTVFNAIANYDLKALTVQVEDNKADINQADDRCFRNRRSIERKSQT